MKKSLSTPISVILEMAALIKNITIGLLVGGIT